MICPHGHAAQHFTGTTAYPMDRYVCDPCKRGYLIGRDGVGRWIRQAGYCGGCDTPTWRMHESPAFGAIPLWPFPATRFPRFRTPNGPGSDSYFEFCAACCPRLGDEAPRLVMEINGDPIEAAECVGYMPEDRYAHLFTDERRAFLSDWLGDHVGLSNDDRDHILTEWDHDRATVGVAA